MRAYTKAELIDLILDEEVDIIQRDPKVLRKLLTNGYKGYKNLKYDKLLLKLPKLGIYIGSC